MFVGFCSCSLNDTLTHNDFPLMFSQQFYYVEQAVNFTIYQWCFTLFSSLHETNIGFVSFVIDDGKKDQLVLVFGFFSTLIFCPHLYLCLHDLVCHEGWIFVFPLGLHFLLVLSLLFFFCYQFLWGKNHIFCCYFFGRFPLMFVSWKSSLFFILSFGTENSRELLEENIWNVSFWPFFYQRSWQNHKLTLFCLFPL